jgi:flavin reductase (DIM6/NTAB) family NADH-FMN oxidoreductase RutF
VGANLKLEKCVAETLSKLADPGALLVGSKKNGSSNVMTIGWGLVGVFWAKLIFLAAVKHSRFTHEFIEDNGEFTVNVPGEGLTEAVSYCGEVSGRKHDKFKECKLTVVKGKNVMVPVIKECKIHYECKVVHKLELKSGLVPADVEKTYYSRRAENDYHTLYFGEIVAVY